MQLNYGKKSHYIAINQPATIGTKTDSNHPTININGYTLNQVRRTS